MDDKKKCGMVKMKKWDGIGTIAYKCSMDESHTGSHRCQTYHPDTGEPGYAMWSDDIEVVTQPDASASPGEWSDYFRSVGLHEARGRVMRFSTGGAWATHNKLPFMPVVDYRWGEGGWRHMPVRNLPERR